MPDLIEYITRKPQSAAGPPVPRAKGGRGAKTLKLELAEKEQENKVINEDLVRVKEDLVRIQEDLFRTRKERDESLGRETGWMGLVEYWKGLAEYWKGLSEYIVSGQVAAEFALAQAAASSTSGGESGTQQTDVGNHLLIFGFSPVVPSGPSTSNSLPQDDRDPSAPGPSGSSGNVPWQKDSGGTPYPHDGYQERRPDPPMDRNGVVPDDDMHPQSDLTFHYTTPADQPAHLQADPPLTGPRADVYRSVDVVPTPESAQCGTCTRTGFGDLQTHSSDITPLIG